MIQTGTSAYIVPIQPVPGVSQGIYTQGFLPERYNSVSSIVVSIPQDFGNNSSTKLIIYRKNKIKSPKKIGEDSIELV